MEEKLCPYCYKSIRENYRSTEDDLICPHPNCGKKIPKIYLQYPVRHIVSIYNKQDFHDYGYELGEYTKNQIVEYMYSRVEYYTLQEDVQIILFEYLREEFSNSTETVVLAIHRCVWDEKNSIPTDHLEHAASILINIDITELRALYFNLGFERTQKEFQKWEPGKVGVFIRNVSEYLRRSKQPRKVAILFANMQYLRYHPYVKEDTNYQKLLEITREWTSDYGDRKWIIESDKIIRTLLLELGEERMIKDADMMTDLKFFLYPNSEFRMASNSFWMLAVLLWMCVKIEE